MWVLYACACVSCVCFICVCFICVFHAFSFKESCLLFWVLGAGCWVLGVGCWVLGAGCWVLGVGCWVLGAYHDTIINSPSCLNEKK